MNNKNSSNINNKNKKKINTKIKKINFNLALRKDVSKGEGRKKAPQKKLRKHI